MPSTTLRLACCSLLLMVQLACHKSTSSTAPTGDGNSTDDNPAGPAVVVAQADIGAAGGTLASPAQDAHLTIPANALAGNTTLTVALVGAPSVASAGLVLASQVFDFGPTGTQFTTPASLTLYVSASATSPNIVLATLSTGGKWQPLAGSNYNAAAGTVTALG